MEWLLYGALALVFILAIGALSAVLMLFIGPPHDTFDVDIKDRPRDGKQ